MNLLEVFTITETIFSLVILIFLLRMRRSPSRKNVSEDLQEIKEQIEG